MNLIKNKFFVTAVCIALVLCIVPTVLSLTGGHDFVRTALHTVATPFRYAFNWIADGVTGFSDYFSSANALLEENERLKEELQQLREDAAKAELVEGENAYLRKLLDFVNSKKEYTMLDASVIGRSANSYSVTYTLNRGSECGIEVNMAVITPDGVAGYISEVGLGYSRAVALTDPTSAIGVYSAQGVYGTVEGSVDYRTDGYCIMGSVTSSLEKGTMLYSSGYGNIYPEGMAVGRIVDSVKDKYGHITRYIIEPAVDFDGLTRVLIVTGRTVTSEVPQESEVTE